jgi:hypothetical protein
MPNPRGEQFVDLNYRLAESDPKGFSPTGAIYFPFSDLVNALPGGPAASLFNDSPVFLVDVDPGSADRLSRHPIFTSVTQSADSFRPANLLQLLPVPGRGLKVNTTYAAVVLRRLGAPGGVAHLGQSPELTELLAGRTPATPQGPALASAFAPLQSALFDMGVHPQDVAAATVFTTGDPTARLIAQVDYVNSLLPLAPTQAFGQRDVYPTFTALTSSFSAPQYQNGFAPFLWSGGEIVTDGLGNPLAQSFKDSPFQLSVPKGVMPAQGFPLYLYCHGTGGTENEAIDRGRMTAAGVQPALGSGLASIGAPRGWGTACAAGVFSPSRIGIMAADGYLAYNFVYPVAMRDNFKQMVLELVHFRNLLKELRIDPALCPGTDASASIDGKVRFDPDRVVVGGQSLGSYLAGMLASTLDGFKGAILTGAGGSWVEFAFGPKSPFDLQQVVELLALPFGEHLDRYHPLVLAFDSGVAQADNTHYLRHLVREPLPGHTPPHVLVIEGYKDQQVATNLQRALALAIGVDFVGPDPGPTPDEQVLPVLSYGSGMAHSPYPLQGNRVIGGQRKTVAMVRYPEDGIREGHYVSFQLDAPKRQIGEFLDAIKAGTVPEIR